MVAGELAEVAAVVSTQVSQWFETDTKKTVDVTAPDNIILTGKLDNGLDYQSTVLVLHEKGSVKPDGQALAIDAADSLTVLLSADTSFFNSPDALVAGGGSSDNFTEPTNGKVATNGVDYAGNA